MKYLILAFLVYCGSLWIVADCRAVVVDRCGWFWVLVTTHRRLVQKELKHERRQQQRRHQKTMI